MTDYKLVNGEYVLLTPEDAVMLAGDLSAWEAGANNREILQQINALEKKQTVRRMSEAVLGIDNGWLANIRAQIDGLRDLLT